MAKNNIKHIDSKSFNDLENLKELDLTDNKIEEIDESIFENLKRLERLYLGGNSLKRIPANIFRNLLNLQNVSLEGNQIRELEPNIFYFNLNIENIWLNNNKIKNLDPNIFSVLKKLEYVDLRGNECVNQYFEGESIQRLGQELSHCLNNDVNADKKHFRLDTKPSIRQNTIDAEIICSLSYVREVETLYTCSIENQVVKSPYIKIKVEPISHAPYVSMVRFDHNKVLTELPRNLGNSFPNLKKISARNTSLAAVDPEVFKNLNFLESKF